ncbi:MAG: hypothetical protein K2L22_02360 [Muribaculaceae bacterium]|nr:hypothetical protein [Muribaculaceae bacterium]
MNCFKKIILPVLICAISLLAINSCNQLDGDEVKPTKIDIEGIEYNKISNDWVYLIEAPKDSVNFIVTGHFYLTRFAYDGELIPLHDSASKLNFSFARDGIHLRRLNNTELRDRLDTIQISLSPNFSKDSRNFTVGIDGYGYPTRADIEIHQGGR